MIVNASGNPLQSIRFLMEAIMMMVIMKMMVAIGVHSPGEPFWRTCSKK